MCPSSTQQFSLFLFFWGGNFEKCWERVRWRMLNKFHLRWLHNNYSHDKDSGEFCFRPACSVLQQNREKRILQCSELMSHNKMRIQQQEYKGKSFHVDCSYFHCSLLLLDFVSLKATYFNAFNFSNIKWHFFYFDTGKGRDAYLLYLPSMKLQISYSKIE